MEIQTHIYEFDTEDKKKAKVQYEKVATYLVRSQIKYADELLSMPIATMELLSKDILLDNLRVVMPYKVHLKNFVDYINNVASEFQTRGYNAKTLLKEFI